VNFLTRFRSLLLEANLFLQASELYLDYIVSFTKTSEVPLLKFIKAVALHGTTQLSHSIFDLSDTYGKASFACELMIEQHIRYFMEGIVDEIQSSIYFRS
jgi:hypothetical protein